MKVLVTGSEGYIGTLLVPMLTARGHKVTRLDALLFSDCNMEDIPTPEQVKIRDIRDVTPADVVGHDAVIHLAGLSNDPLSDLAPELTRQINHHAATRLAQIAKQVGVGRFIFSSTCSVYGFQGDNYITEDSSFNPLTVYAESKVNAEREISALADDAFRVVNLRHGTAYGASPMTRFDLVLNNLIAWAKATGGVYLKSDGGAWRPLVHVEDICIAFVAALEETASNDPVQVFNIGRTRDNLKVVDLAEMIADKMGCKVVYAPDASPDHRSYRVDCTKAETSLPGFTPIWTVEKGIEQVIAAVKTHNITVEDIEGHRFGRIAHLRHKLSTGAIDPALRIAEKRRA